MDIKQRLKVNSIVTALCVLSGTALTITGLSTTGSRIDRQEFCFKPEPLYQTQKLRIYVGKNYKTKTVRTLIPYKQKYCQGNKLYIGVSWRIAEQIDNNPELRKIHFKRKLPAKRPLSGIYTLLGSSFYFVAWLIWEDGSRQYYDNLQRIIKQKEQEVIETKLIAQKQIELLTNRHSHETEYVRELQDRQHGSKLSELMGEGEKLHHQDVAQKKRELIELQHELRKANTKALTAEECEKEAKHLLEVQKLQGKLSDPWQEEKQDLKKLLREHEGGWLWDLVETITPIVIYGRSGSYKSYTAACLVLLKHHFLGASLESIADPQWHQNRTGAWKELIYLEPKEYGEQSNWDGEIDSYKQAIYDLLDRCKTRNLQSEPIISVWDELTKLGQYLPEDSKVFMPEVVSSPRKAKEHCILLTHNITQAGLGNVERMSETIKEGTFRLKLGGSNSGDKPSFKGKLDGWLNSDGELVEELPITLPDWFRVETIKELISEK